MMLSTTARKYLVNLLNATSEKPAKSLYEYLENPAELREIIPRALEKVKELVPPLFENRVAQALNELSVMADRLEKELTNPSRHVLGLSKKVVESLESNDTSELKKYIADNFLELSNIFVLDKGEEPYFDGTAVFNVKKSDLTKIAYMYPSNSLQTSLLNFIDDAYKYNGFRRFLYSIAGRYVSVDDSKLEVYVAGDVVKMSQDGFTRLLIAFNKPDVLKEHLRRLYSDQLNELSRRLGVDVELVGTSIIDTGTLHAKATLAISDAGRSIGKPTKEKFIVNASIVYEDGEPRGVDVYLTHGEFSVLVGGARVSKRDWVSHVHNILHSQRFDNCLRALDSAINTLREHGYRITNITSIVDDEVMVEAVKEPFSVNYTFKYMNNSGELLLSINTPRQVARSASNYTDTTTTPIPAEIKVEDNAVRVRVNAPSLPDLKIIEELAMKTLDKLTKRMESSYSRLREDDAAAIYVMHRWYAVGKNTIREFLNISPALLWSKASRVIKSVSTTIPPKVAITMPEYMLENKIVEIDSEGFVRVFGKRLVDVSQQYFGTTEFGEIAERRILDSLLEHVCEKGVFNEFFSNKRPPPHIISILIEEAEHSRYMSRASDYLLRIAGDRNMWEALTPDEKTQVAMVLGETLFTNARDKNWEWILRDKKISLIAATIGLKNPSDITKVIATDFPELLGTDYELVKIGDEYFIKHEKTYLQVRKVLYDELVFQGAPTGSNIGMVTKAKNLKDACRTIQETLLDNFIELRELVSDLKSKGHLVVVGKFETPAFSVPYLLLTVDWRQFVIPLQPKFREKIEKMLSKEDRQTTSEDVVVA